ncbi:MAG: YfhO family protein [Candidatus Brocadiaceae bacterium]|nr:YfhO family protein [Candidatus Brocadiaceae bacterium]
MGWPTDRRSAVRRELGPLFVLLLACGLFFRKAVALRGVFFHYDHALQNYPFRAFFAQGLRQGRLRLWTPDLFCGFPLLAESQGNPLYPPFLVLFRFLPAWVAYNYYTVLHFFLAGAFAYALARVHRVGRAGAVAAGLCYMLCGPVIAHAHHTNIVVGVSYLPLLLVLIELACRRRHALSLSAFAAATALLVLGAQPQYTLYCVLPCGAYLVWRLGLIEATGGSRRTVAGLLVGFALAGLLAAALAGAQLLPLLELVGRSMRAGDAQPLAGADPGVPGNLMTLLLPHYWGSPGLAGYWGAVEPGLYAEITLFMGVVPLLLAFVAVGADRSRRAVFFAGLGVFSFLFAMGSSGVIRAVFSLLPIFRSARLPSRFAFVTALCVAVLAGMGLDALLHGTDRRRVRRSALRAAGLTLALCATALVIAWAATGRFASLSREGLARAFPLSPARLEHLWNYFHGTLPADMTRRALAAIAGTGLVLLAARRTAPSFVIAGLLCALIFGELAWTARDSNAVTAPTLYSVPPPLAQAVRALPPGRILRHRIYDAVDPAQPPALFPDSQGWAVRPRLYARSFERLPHNVNMLWGIPSVNGFSPLQTRALKALLGMRLVPATLGEVPISPALDLLNVRWILTPTPDLPGGFTHVDRIGDVHIFENPRALPRACIVHRASRAVDDRSAGAILRDAERFDPRERILLHDDAEPPLWLDDGTQGADESVRIIRDDGDRIRLAAELSRPGYVVLADQHYPGWTATVDGRPAALLRANVAVKAVRLPPGRHEVVLEFRPRSFRVGLLATLGGLVVLTACALLGLRRRAGRASAEPAGTDDLLGAPCGVRPQRLLAFAAVLLLGLGPVLHGTVWRILPLQLSPRWYVQKVSISQARDAASRDRADEAYAIVRDAARWWPQNPLLRHVVVRYASDAVAEHIRAGRVEEAGRLAREVLDLAPHARHSAGGAILRTADRAARRAEGTPLP